MKHMPDLCVSRWCCCLGDVPLRVADVHGPRVRHVDHTTRFLGRKTRSRSRTTEITNNKIFVAYDDYQLFVVFLYIS